MSGRGKIVAIGGGIAGTEASMILAELGYEVSLIEKEQQTGGKLNKWNCLFPNERPACEITGYLGKCSQSTGINVISGASVIGAECRDNHFFVKTDNGDIVQSDAVLISTGFETFDAVKKEEYGYSIYENVITSVDLEDLLRKGKPVLTSKGERPRRIAFIHCVGSRDEKSGHHHCSRVCCITGVKQAIELSRLLPEAEIFCFYMDLRMFGLPWESLYRQAQEKYNIQFIRGRLSEASENQDESLVIKAEDTLSGRPLKMKADLMVLLVGMIPGRETSRMADLFGLNREPNGFLQTQDPHLRKNRSSRGGIFLAGTCTGPMTVDETLDHARSAALDIHRYLLTKNV